MAIGILSLSSIKMVISSPLLLSVLLSKITSSRPITGIFVLTWLPMAGRKAPQHIAQVVKEIRQSKLPNPAELGNSGSFFKNPMIPRAQFLELQKHYPNMPHYSIGDDQEKIPAAYLIERCDLKGYRIDAVGVHQGQPLVMVNYGGATGAAILALARYVQQQVKKRFDILMEMEVNIW